MLTLFLFFHTHRTIASSSDKLKDEDHAKFQEPLLQLVVT